MNLTSAYEEALRCNRCGFCQAVCPVFRVAKKESRVARGHNLQLRGIVEKELRAERGVLDASFDCLLCRKCVETCFPSVKTDEIVLFLRRYFRRRTALERFAFGSLLPKPARLSSFIKLLYQLKPLGESIRKVGFLSWLTPALRKAVEMGERLPSRFLKEQLDNLPEPHSIKGEVNFFLSCGFNYALPETGLRNLKALVGVGYRVRVLENVCCGLPAFAYGDYESARKLALRNLPLLRGRVVVDCASCYSFLKDYPTHFGIRPTAEILDVAEVLYETEIDELPLRATYHEPCHFARYHKPSPEPRDLLRRIGGLEFVEMNEADWCCGSAGFYALTHPEHSDEILRRKMLNIRTSGAEVLVTSCPACMLQLSYGVKKFHMDVRVVHTGELVLQALEGKDAGNR